MKIRPAVNSLLRFCMTGAAMAAAVVGMAWLVRPELSSVPPTYPTDQVEAAERSRRIEIDPANPPTLYRQVDYGEGVSAQWYPKGESPMLAELVGRGRLPPVAERVGAEPAVVEGAEGIGRYGGTWIRVGTSDSDVFGVMNHRMSYACLVRWSPQGYPIVPHVARSFEVSDDYRRFTFTLRKGMKWSDGHPFTADDVLYWWEHEANDKRVYGMLPVIMKVRGKAATVTKLGTYRFQVTFPQPNGLFLPRLATSAGRRLINSPRHYLIRYHPRLGDGKLIGEVMESRRLPSRRAAYRAVGARENPECPRLWPWVYRTHRPGPPYSFVRNPYYWMVDTRGNQLPYVDRVHVEVKSPGMIGLAASNGQVTMQARHIRFDQYTLLMGGRAGGRYDVRHWHAGDRSVFAISPNLNRRVDPSRPETAKKRRLLNEKKFRQALSLAIDRRAIIDAEFEGICEPAQVAPGPASAFYEPSLYTSYTEYDPDRANRLLDELGLTRRDQEGCRTFPDGSRMLFYLNICGFIPAGPAQFVVDDWAGVGVRVILRVRSRRLWETENSALEHDLNAWTGNSEYLPILNPRYFVPLAGASNYALGYALWYARGGLYGDPQASVGGCIAPPPGHGLRRAMQIYEKVYTTGDRRAQREIFGEALKIAAENVWTINIATPPPVLAVVKDGFRNVPRNVVSCWDFMSPGNAGIETYFFDRPRDSPGAVRQMQQSILTVTPPPEALAAPAPGLLGRIIKYVFCGIAALLVALAALRHPYVGRRLLIMLPTLAVISAIVFVIIQLPPGDFLTARIMQLREAGEEIDLKEVAELQEQFHLNESMPRRYARWVGLVWLTSFDAGDAGLLQGNLGRSMENSRPVNEIVGDRIVLTVLISLGTILLTWAVAIPTGMLSAVRQYSLADYVLTFVAFLGMCVPSFLLALLLMYAAKRYMGVDVSGLLSARFGAQPEWDWPKVWDLLKHVWLPVVVLGVGGTAGMIRVMRGNLLDELKKPYVITARAKGVRPLRLLLKYPVRMALNPFISGIGGLFPHLVSGGAIVAMVLSLPTVGPLMLQALMTEDMYLAGSMLMVLSLLAVFGTLVSDLLLLWLDPRIRLTGGSR